MQRHRMASLLGLALLGGCSALPSAPVTNVSAEPQTAVIPPTAVESIRSIADGIKQGKGAIGRLVESGLVPDSSDPLGLSVSPEPARRSVEASAGSAEPFAPLSTPKAQGRVSMSTMHPPTMVAATVAVGTEDFALNTGTSNPNGDATAVFAGIRGEHFFPSQMGAFLSADFGSSDKIDDLGDVEVETSLLYLAFAYRATVDNDFRMPVRLGPFFHKAEAKGFINGKTEYSTVGLKLAAEPEFILMQKIDAAGRMSEFTVFLELGVGAGPSKVEDPTDDETGYAWRFDAELGVRWKLPMGLVLGLSLIDRKQNYGTTDSYDNTAFFGTDDDYFGVGLMAGGRF